MNYGRIHPGKWTTDTESRPLTPVYPEPGSAGRRALTPMPSSNAIAPPSSTARFQFWTVNSRLFCSNSFRFTYFRKNASATPLESHSFKTKDLKPFRITYLQKKGGGRGVAQLLLAVSLETRLVPARQPRPTHHQPVLIGLAAHRRHRDRPPTGQVLTGE